MDISISHTLDKLRQLGVRVRLKGNDQDRLRYVLLACARVRVAPVAVDQRGEVAY